MSKTVPPLEPVGLISSARLDSKPSRAQLVTSLGTRSFYSFVTVITINIHNILKYPKIFLKCPKFPLLDLNFPKIPSFIPK